MIIVSGTNKSILGTVNREERAEWMFSWQCPGSDSAATSCWSSHGAKSRWRHQRTEPTAAGTNQILADDISSPKTLWFAFITCWLLTLTNTASFQLCNKKLSLLSCTHAINPPHTHAHTQTRWPTSCQASTYFPHNNAATVCLLCACACVCMTENSQVSS